MDQPPEPSSGSLVNTGHLNQLYPQYKRVVALRGDVKFLPTSSWKTQNLVLLEQAFEINPDRWLETVVHFLDDYFVNLPTNLDPNTGLELTWPDYASASPDIFTFQDSNQLTLKNDTYLVTGIDFMTSLLIPHPLERQ
ncbi:hypothetical protein GALMADRAFT_214301 [Galerina marginata CBS 339.88]|uniref:Uncharacterized protein n=1 Tax=Galerina marginata (strain CBS 339.88) TaxID=685588 RepID=A0A067SJ66_GALM3|nr:hypothetical protein GALMADRAFT_214301 [Galerina marginata CBS 339.88]